MDASSATAPALGESFTAVIPENSHPAISITVANLTTPGTFTPEQEHNLVWSLKYQALYHYNRSPWVERDYSAPVADVRLLAPGEAPPAGSWHVELLDTSTEPGALGWHEDEAHASKTGPSGAHSLRGLAAGTETPLSKVFCKTSREDGVNPSEVASHEINEMMVDPWVTNEAEIRVYTDPANGKEYIGEVGDPVQGRGYDVGLPEGRPCKVPEAIVADFALPAWWGQPQRRLATAFCSDTESWTGATVPAPNLAPFELAPGGYMSVRVKGGEWEQIFGADKQKAEANAHGYERPGEAT